MNGPAGGTAAASDGDNNDVHLSRKWRDDRWLKEHEGTGLTEANVLDYFALSEWYDQECLTNQLNMQGHRLESRNPEILKSLAGTDYKVVTVFPPEPEKERQRIFVIEKVRRTKREGNGICDEERLACYYVLPDGWVFMSPPVQRLMDGKLQSIAHSLNAALTKCMEHYTFSLAGGQALPASSQDGKAQPKEEIDAMPVMSFQACHLKPTPVPDVAVLEDSLLNEMVMHKMREAYPPQQHAPQHVHAGNWPGGAPGAAVPLQGGQMQGGQGPAGQVQGGVKRGAGVAVPPPVPQAKKART